MMSESSTNVYQLPELRLTRAQAIRELASRGKDSCQLATLSTPDLQRLYRLTCKTVRPILKNGAFVGIEGTYVVVVDGEAKKPAKVARQLVIAAS